MALRLVRGTLARNYRGSSARDTSHVGRVSSVNENIRISEIFGPTIQGEGPLIGRPSVFVRTAGCDYRCSWCDTLYAVLTDYRHEWQLMSASQVVAQVTKLAGDRPILVTLSGGNPALQPLNGVIAAGQACGHSFALETQGSVSQPWFAMLDWLLLSPKPPSSGITTDCTELDACIDAAGCKPRCALKFVIFDKEDYAFARSVASRYPELSSYLQVGNPSPLRTTEASDAADMDDLMRRLRWLVAKAVEDRWFTATVLPQLHVLAWGNKRGV
jgi:7-carboxy-7-deazaguanine synthase